MFTQKLKISDNSTVNTYLYQKAAEHFGSYLEESTGAAIRWGNEYEVDAIELYMDRTGRKVTKYGDEQEFIDVGLIGATPDGIEHSGRYHYLVQVKCPHNPANHIKHLTVKTHEDFKALATVDKNVKKHFCQMQHEMYVALRHGYTVKGEYFISYDPRLLEKSPELALHIVLIKPDYDFVQTLKQALTKAEEEIKEIIKKVR